MPFFSPLRLCLFLLVLWWLLSAHSISPSESAIHFAALKHLGVRTIIVFSAVCSLRRFPTSFFDGTGLVARAGFSNPCSPHPAAWLADTVQSLKAEGRAVKPRTKKTLGVMEGHSFAHIATSTNYDAWRPHEACVTAAEAHKNAALASVLPEYFKVP
ncbi:hypothetical protein B0H13DRAFT_2280718 [Mycena leptocephala]|nr:hypothetical protein B0H13DRAFT_2280718 [Mycena leptocephala]